MPKKKPAWVPEAIWSEYRADELADCPATPEWLRATANQLLFDKRCAPAWVAITRRSEKFNARFKPMSGNDPFSSAFWMLCHNVWRGRSGLSLGQTLTTKERKKIAAGVVDAVGKLGEKLTYLRAHNGDWNADFNGYFSTGYLQRCYSDGIRLAQAQLDVERFPHTLDRALLSLCESATRWAETVGAVGQPHAPNADRLYFLQTMTLYFRTAYQTPLREITAAITRGVFDCEMSAATVAKLAP